MTVNWWKISFVACFAALIGVPMLFRPAPADSARDTANLAIPLIIITPHNEQIRYEFKRSFEAWHRRNYGRGVNVIYNVPGGTSEIRKMLESQFIAAIESGRDPGGDADLVFGGGTFEHARLKRGVSVTVNGREHVVSISQPVDFSQEWLDQTFGLNRIGDDPLYDAERYWFGLALSGFGIVFNRDVLQALHVPTPQTWTDLCDPRLQGWVALVNPNQSGSVTTAFESIFKRVGWEQGWQILRRAGANSRYFSASSLKPPMDVSQGNAAMGVCIDFFGRYQSQALKDAGDADRIGYVDPPGVPLDADPISMLRNAPQPEVARRFIEFCLSNEGQALWQFRRKADAVRDPEQAIQFGPNRHELRRMPILRSMYDAHFDELIDQVNPFELAMPAAYPDSNMRDFIAPIFAAMVMDAHQELKDAWRVIASRASKTIGHKELLTAASIDDPKLREMLELFDAMPSINGPGAIEYSLHDATHLATIRQGWFRGGWSGENLWHGEASPGDVMRRQCAAFFRKNYRQIIEMAETLEPQ